MNRWRRQEGKLIRISQIHHGEMVADGDFQRFSLFGNIIPRVRIFGVVVSTYSSPSKQVNRYATICIDDGSDTIDIRLWYHTERDQDIQRYELFTMLTRITVGQIVDIIGQVMEYKDVKYISPGVIAQDQSLDWELYRRTQLIQQDLDNPLATPMINTDPIKTRMNHSMIELLDYINENEIENTVDQIAFRAHKSKEEVEEMIINLREQGYLISPRPGHVLKIRDKPSESNSS
ncbi:MAG: hypothetical protein ACXAB7_18310 [Candidatus Kariarchaeaceae archaeon]